MPAGASAGVSILAVQPQGEVDSDRQGPALLLLLNGLTSHMPSTAGSTSLSLHGWGWGYMR